MIRLEQLLLILDAGNLPMLGRWMLAKAIPRRPWGSAGAFLFLVVDEIPLPINSLEEAQ